MLSKYIKKSLLWVLIAALLTVMAALAGLSNSKAIAKNNNISHEEFKGLVLNSYNSVIQMDKLRADSNFKDTDGLYYSPLKKDIKNYASLYQYFDEELSLSKYFSKDFIDRFVKHVTKDINGHYYMLLGNFGIPIKDANLTSQKWDDDKLNVTFNGVFKDNDTVKFHAIIIYDGNWKFDKVDLWGFNKRRKILPSSKVGDSLANKAT